MSFREINSYLKETGKFEELDETGSNVTSRVLKHTVPSKLLNM